YNPPANSLFCHTSTDLAKPNSCNLQYASTISLVIHVLSSCFLLIFLQLVITALKSLFTVTLKLPFEIIFLMLFEIFISSKNNTIRWGGDHHKIGSSSSNHGKIPF